MQNTYGQLGSTNVADEAVVDLSPIKIVIGNFIFDMLDGFQEDFIHKPWESDILKKNHNIVYIKVEWAYFCADSAIVYSCLRSGYGTTCEVRVFALSMTLEFITANTCHFVSFT